MTTPLVSVSVQSHGMALASVQHRGTTFVAGEQGERYEIVVHNNSAGRVEVVVSVDGIDVVSGRAADFTRQRGYVVEPFGVVVIDGFRTSLDQVAAFRFSSVGDSFAAKTGSARNVGIIGVAAFQERPRSVARHHAPSKGAKKDRSASASSAPSSAESWDGGGSRGRELGTEFAELRDSAVRQVSFVRANAHRPELRTSIQYDTARGLAARGVPIEPEPWFREPEPVADAWPGADPRFAQPPPGWNRRGPSRGSATR